MKKQKPFGSWESPISPDFVAGKDRNLIADLQVEQGSLYFLESRPDEGGRQVLMKRDPNGKTLEVLPPKFNVRSRYLEYGGSAYCVRGGVVFFVNFSDQQIYRQDPGLAPVRITADSMSRFADLSYDGKRNRLIALRELQVKPESKNSVCTIDLSNGSVRDLVTGRDFFHCARLNPQGSKIVWIGWDHPNMAWNGTELWLAEIADSGEIRSAEKIAGDSSHGICQAQWKNDEQVLFVGELENWFNLHLWQKGTIKNLAPMEAEFAAPDWNPGQKHYAIHENTVCASFTDSNGSGFLFLENEEKFVSPFRFAAVSRVEPSDDGFFAVVSFPDKAPAIIHLKRDGSFFEIYSSYRLALKPSQISVPRAISFPTGDGLEGHAWFYEPMSEAFEGILGEKPPLIVICHGGPTSSSPGEFRKMIQFWTSRGYSVVDVNYGGSSGFGRQYRERLRGKWGEVDVQDCVSAVEALAREGRIDPKRVAIRGGSAGGFTVLTALIFTKGVFCVGASYYGVSDLELLASDTHKLEARYLDQLIGPYPEALDIYKARSPLSNTDRLNCPVIFFQGSEDNVVPPNQSKLMHEALAKKGIATELYVYDGEGHGFRKAETVQHSLVAEHVFYSKFMGFSPGGYEPLGAPETIDHS